MSVASVSRMHAPFLRCALSALKQDPAARLDKRCARLHTNGRRQIKRCKRTDSFMLASRSAGSVYSTFLASRWRFLWPPRSARILAAEDQASMHVVLTSISTGKTSRGLQNNSGFKRSAVYFWSAKRCAFITKAIHERAFIRYDTCATRADLSSFRRSAAAQQTCAPHFH